MRRDCQNPVIGTCVEYEYRGCTLNFCEEHSGQVYRKKHEWICCKPCGKDQHVDICQECSSDILNARFKFYVITLILSILIFFMLLYSVHLMLKPPSSSCLDDNQTLCGSLKQAVNSSLMNPSLMNAYNKSYAAPANLEKANTSLHMFNQVDKN